MARTNLSGKIKTLDDAQDIAANNTEKVYGRQYFEDRCLRSRQNCQDHQRHKSALEDEYEQKDQLEGLIFINFDTFLYFLTSCLIFDNVTVLIKGKGGSISYEACAVRFFHEEEDG